MSFSPQQALYDRIATQVNRYPLTPHGQRVLNRIGLARLRGRCEQLRPDGLELVFDAILDAEHDHNRRSYAADALVGKARLRLDEEAACDALVLEKLADTGARVVATTHYNLLKEMAEVDHRFANASVEFDADTLEPTYRLKMGLPGASSAEVATSLKVSYISTSSSYTCGCSCSSSASDSQSAYELNSDP